MNNGNKSRRWLYIRCTW